MFDVPDFENDPARVRQAIMPDSVQFPRCAGFGQFSLYILTLEKQAYGLRPLKRPCITQQFGERRASPGSDEIEGLRPRLLHPRVADFDRNLHPLGGDDQERAFLGDGFVEHCFEARPLAQHRRQHQSRKAGAATKVHQAVCRFRHEAHQLRRVPDMALPDMLERVLRNEIVPRIPFGQQPDIGLQPEECFT